MHLLKIELQSTDQAADKSHIPHLMKHKNVILVHYTVLQSYCNTVSAQAVWQGQLFNFQPKTYPQTLGSITAYYIQDIFPLYSIIELQL